MGELISGQVSSSKVLLDGVLNIVGSTGVPRIILVNQGEYQRNNYIKNAVYVLCTDKTDITTLFEVYCNGSLVATTEAELALYIGVLPSVIF